MTSAHEPDDGWAESSEGDLDPDLTEEAGYSDWDPVNRGWWPLVLRIGLVVLILALLAPVILTAAIR
jgi:hypothetical protein